MQEIRVLASFAAILVASGPMLAQSGRDGCGTVVPGGPVAGETWTAAGSPYCVTGDLFISNLTIEPGVTVLMDGPWRLNVQTTIHAEGTEQEPIVFTAADPMASKWKGMMFDQTVPGSVLRHCHFSHADDSALRVVDAPPTIDQCRFEQNTSTTNGGAINATGHVGDFWVRDSVINSNTANHHGGAIFADIESGTLHLRDSRFESNINNTPLQNGSFHGGGAHVTGNLEVLRCTFEGNVARSQTESFADRVSTGGGILVRDGDVTITQSLFVNNRADCLNNGNLTTRRARGSAVYIRANVELSNVIIGGNMLGGASEESGGGIYVESGEVTATNVTIARNERARPQQHPLG
jgi:predicted outer membrane repeat protein